MHNTRSKLRELLLSSDWTMEGRQWLQEYVRTADPSEIQDLMRELFNQGEGRTLDMDSAERILEMIHAKTGMSSEAIGISDIKRYNIRKLWTRGLVAACLLALVGIGVRMIMGNSNRASAGASAAAFGKVAIVPGDKAAGIDKASVTLSDGSVIVLDSAQRGVLAKQGSTSLFMEGNKLVYKPSTGDSTRIFYNSITTPRGGEFHVELPDGSLVWLNDESSIRFPTAFSGKERRVEISGEAYFEIAKNASKPFFVNIRSSEIQVLGTHFNVSGYSDEAVLKTTLLEGSIKFVHGSSSEILKPGQQARLADDGTIKIEDQVHLKVTTAWKEGYFRFEAADITTVMTQLSRWYDVDVVYAGEKPTDLFYADIPRDTRLSTVLKALEIASKLKFTIEQNKIIVSR